MSTLGGAFGTLANGWVLFELTGSETALSTLWILYFLPSLVVQLAAGPYLDRWRRTRILFWSHGLRGMLFLFPAALWWAGALEPWHLYGVSAVSGVIQAVYAPASLAAIPSVVPSMLLQGANARLDGTFRLLSMLGPVIGGGVVAAWGPTLTWAAVVCSFLGGASLLAGIKEERPPRQPQGTTWVKQFQEEIDIFRNQSILWVLARFLAVVQLGVGVLMVLGLPFVSRELEGGRSRLWLVCGRFSPGICPRLSAPFPDGATGPPAAGDAGRQSAGRSHFCRAFPGGKYRDCRGAGDHRRDECPLFSCLLHHALSETGPSAGWKPREKVPEVGVGMKVEEGLQESYRKRMY